MDGDFAMAISSGNQEPLSFGEMLGSFSTNVPGAFTLQNESDLGKIMVMPPAKKTAGKWALMDET